jgi:hypothetical protein
MPIDWKGSQHDRPTSHQGTNPMTQHQAPEVTSELREQLALFVRESNWIEGIRRDPTEAEISAHAIFLSLPKITLDALVDLVAVLQPDARIRDRVGLNVYVGEHVPPPGGLAIPLALYDLLERVGDPYLTHAEYETLHPFTDGNGRSGRALWLWTMGGKAPLGFLHHWYYQSLAGNGFRGKADTRATQPLSLTVDDETVARLRKRYTAETVPPCPVCGEPLSIQAAGGGSITWGCVKRDDGKSPLDDHYERSRWQQFRTGDSDVIALLDRLQSLSLPVAGEQIAENANCSGDIDRSGLAQEVE